MRKILIINLGGIGDVLLSQPALCALKKRYPRARVVFLGVARTTALARDLGFFDEVIPLGAYDDKRRAFRMTHVTQAVKVLASLRRERFNCAVNMRSIISWPSALKMALLFLIVGARQRVGRDTAHRGFFFNKKIEESHFGNRHEMDYGLDLVALLGADPSGCVLDVKAGAGDVTAVDRVLDERGIKGWESLIGIHAGGVPAHQWPLENLAKAMTQIAEEGAGVRFILTGGEGEEGLFDRLQALTSAPIINMVQRTSFGQLVALIDRCRVFISNDTGPMHVAAALGRPLVAIMGGGPFRRYDPRRVSPKAVVLHKEVACAPCTKKRCSDLRCLKEITPQDVAQAALKLLSES